MVTSNSYPNQSGNQTSYTISFQYLDASDVRCEIDGSAVAPSEYTVSGSEVTFNTAPVGNLVISRSTPVLAKEVDFTPSSPIRAADLNRQNDQFLFSLQELWEQGSSGGSGGSLPDGAVVDADFTSNGLMVRSGSGIYKTVSLEAGSNLAIDHADGTTGNPRIRFSRDPVWANELANDVGLVLDGLLDQSTVIGNILGDFGSLSADVSQLTFDLAAEAQSRQSAILAEQNARAAAVSALAADISAEQTTRAAETLANANAIAQEVSDRAAAVQAETDARIAAFTQEQADRVSAIQAEADARAAGLLEAAKARGELAYDIESLYAEVANALAAVVTEREVRADETEALARESSLLAAKVDENAASILTESAARASALSAQASQISVLQADVAAAEASITSEAAARASEDAALSTRIDNLQATFINGDFTAAINSEASARASADEALSQRIDLFTAESGENFSLAFGLITALVNKEEATSQFTLSLKSDFNDNISRIDTDLSTLSTATSANASAITVLQTDVANNAAAVVTEQNARAAADSALSSSLSLLTGRVDDAEANILSAASLELTRFNANLQRIENLQAELAGAFGGIVSDTEVVLDATEALVRDFTFLSARVGSNEASITAEQTARANADSALASDILTVDARVDDANSSIVNASAASVSRDNAQIQQIEALKADFAGVSAALLADVELTADETSALARQFEFLSAEVDGVAAAVSNEQTARADADTALASDISALQAATSNNASAITTEASARADGDSANTLLANTAQSTADTAVSLANTAQTTAASALSANATNTDLLLAELAGALAATLARQEAQIDENVGFSISLTNNEVAIGDVSAQVATESQARVDGDNALAQQINQLSIDIGNQYATIQTVSNIQTTANAALQTADTNTGLIGGLTSSLTTVDNKATQGINDASEAQGTANTALGKIEASYTLRIDVNGNVSGFGLANDGQQSEFAVLADRFLIADPNNPSGTPEAVFAVDNGVTYIKEANIGDATIGTLKLKNGSATEVKTATLPVSTFYYIGTPSTSVDKRNPANHREIEVNVDFDNVEPGNRLTLLVNLVQSARLTAADWMAFEFELVRVSRTDANQWSLSETRLFKTSWLRELRNGAYPDTMYNSGAAVDQPYSFIVEDEIPPFASGSAFVSPAAYPQYRYIARTKISYDYDIHSNFDAGHDNAQNNNRGANAKEFTLTGIMSKR